MAGSSPTLRVAELEHALSSATGEEVEGYLDRAQVDASLLEAALLVKRTAAQIDVMVHAIGIVMALPHVLEAGERVSSLSLGAGNTGRSYDLETDRQVAEFTFIGWRGGAESIRQNKLFIDLFRLASAKTPKRRVLYVVGRAIPMGFLKKGRAIRSVLSRNQAAAQAFAALHGDRYATVKDYYGSVRDAVEIVDLAGLVPGIESIADIDVADATGRPDM